jgi:dephospho-CoA kinase
MLNSGLFVGITGGIGSGKSTVANVFACMGVPVLQADALAKFLINHHTDLKQSLVALLGPETYNQQGYNKKYVANKIFEKPELLQQVNQLVHPLVRSESKIWFEQQQTPYCIYEAALINKDQKGVLLDKIIVIEAPLAQRLDAISKRDHRTPEQIHQIINSQQSVEEYRTFADYIIQNNYNQSIINQVIEIDKFIRPSYDKPLRQFIP